MICECWEISGIISSEIDWLWGGARGVPGLYCRSRETAAEAWRGKTQGTKTFLFTIEFLVTCQLISWSLRRGAEFLGREAPGKDQHPSQVRDGSNGLSSRRSNVLHRHRDDWIDQSEASLEKWVAGSDRMDGLGMALS